MPHLGKECSDGSLTLWGDETTSVLAPVPHIQKDRVSSDRIIGKTTTHTHNPVDFGVGTICHSDQNVAIAMCSPREQVNEWQGDFSPREFEIVHKERRDGSSSEENRCKRLLSR